MLKQRGDWVEALVNLGLACWKFQDLDGATQTFEKILSLQPRNTDALRALTLECDKVAGDVLLSARLREW